MPDSSPGQRREARLLLVTIGVSIGMLLLLARFRFPEEATGRLVEPAAAPLERLAARATFDELASSMADLERRLANRVDVLRIEPERTPGGFVPAPRLTPDRVVVLLRAGEQVVAGASAEIPLIVGRDPVRELAVVAAAPARPDDVVTLRAGPPRPGPRYVAVVEATGQGPAVRPVYVGRTDLIQDPRLNTPLLSVVALQQTVPRGAAIFALDGQLIGLASDSGGGVTIVPSEALRTLAEQAQTAPGRPADLGVQVQPLSPALARASGADRGVMVSSVQARGPAANDLLSGDVIRGIDGTGVTTVAGFQQLMATRQPGQAVALDVVRQGKPVQVSVRAVEAAALETALSADSDPGLLLRTIQGAGIEVVALEPRMPGARAELQRGDLIVAIDGRAAVAAGDLLRTYRERPRGGAVLLTIRRGTQHRVVALEKP
jgi:S1-C subfamily serine protease